MHLHRVRGLSVGVLSHPANTKMYLGWQLPLCIQKQVSICQDNRNRLGIVYHSQNPRDSRNPQDTQRDLSFLVHKSNPLGMLSDYIRNLLDMLWVPGILDRHMTYMYINGMMDRAMTRACSCIVATAMPIVSSSNLRLFPM